MGSDAVPDVPPRGFNYQNFHRNELLASKGLINSNVKFTGTTVAGIMFKGGVILAADQRATNSDIISDKFTKKIHHYAPNIAAGGAGTSADTDAVEKMINAQLELHRLSTGKEVPVSVALTKISHHLFRYQGHIGCALILGGCDKNGPYLGTISPNGYIQKCPHGSMGSGSLAATSVLEAGYKHDMELEEATELVKQATLAGVENDLGSGGSIDLCIITPNSKKYIRFYYTPPFITNIAKADKYKFKRGSTKIISTKIVKPEIEEEIVRRVPQEPMDVA